MLSMESMFFRNRGTRRIRPFKKSPATIFFRLFPDLQKFKRAEHGFRTGIRVFGCRRHWIVLLRADQKDVMSL